MIIDIIKKSVPEYKVKLPGLNKTFSYRPMLVKEEKFLSTIMTVTSSFEDKLINLCSLVDSCFDNKINSTNLTMSDFQIAINEIRTRSIDETVNFKLTCPSTKEIVNVSLDLDSFVIHNTKHNLNVKLKENVILSFKPITIKSLFVLSDFPETKSDWFDLICSSLYQIETISEKINLDGTSIESKKEYLELIPRSDFKKVKEFVTRNCISFKVKYKTSDDIDREIEVDDFANFLKFYLVILTL